MMFGLQLQTFDREAVAANSAAAEIIKSYLRMRMAIGLLGVLLPVMLVFVDWWFVRSRHPIRGSMSAYYHSSARDIFVGGLIATGLFLITYMSAKKRTYDYVLSTTAGVLVMVVAMFPTARSGRELGAKGFQPGSESCVTYPGPPPCNGFQSKWGEDTVRNIHQFCACSFVVLLVILCIVFALREFGYGPEAKTLVGPTLGVGPVHAALRQRRVSTLTYLWKGLPAGAESATGAQPRPPRRRVLSYLASALAIMAGASWALLGRDVSLPLIDGEVGRTYVGEFVAFVSFGIAWLTAAWDLMPMPVKALSESAAHAVDSISGAAPPATG